MNSVNAGSDINIVNAGSDIDKKLHLLCVAGKEGIIKIIDIKKGRMVGYMKGHTGAIHNLVVAEHILISCSEDGSIRLWNLYDNQCVGVFGGVHGHKDHVLDISLNYARNALTSVGIDATIKQWKFDFNALINQKIQNYIFLQKPSHNFTHVHKAAITRVRHYGNFILTLCNHIILAIYNNLDIESIDLLDKNFNENSAIFIGRIDLYNNCKTFEIIGHVLVAVSNEGDIYMFDLRELGKESTPYLIESNLKEAEDFIILDEYIYITAGYSIHRFPFDISRFDRHDDNNEIN